jgi:YVTN family beta-propeller protein
VIRRPALCLIVAAVLLSLAGDVSAVKRSSCPLAITRDGRILVVANPESHTVSLVRTADGELLDELEVGIEPRSVAIADSGSRAFVANLRSDSVSEVSLEEWAVVAEIPVGGRPAGVLVDPTGSWLYVAVQGDARVSVIDLGLRQVIGAIAVAERPTGLALTEDGRTLLVSHLLAGSMSVIGLDPDSSEFPGGSTVDELAMWPDSNLAASVVLSPDGSRALVPHTRSNSSNRVLTFDTTVFPVVSQIDVVGRRHLVGEQLALDILDPPGVGLPLDLALALDGNTAYVVNAASNDLTVVDLVTRSRIAHVEVGDHPRGVVLSPDGDRAYVSDTLSGTVSVIDTSSHVVVDEITVTELPLPPALLTGKRLFFSSDDERLARSQWIACASCHFDGEHDGRSWNFGFAGPRNTTSLMGMVQTYPLRWSAEWDESADSEFAITREQFGGGLLAGEMHPTLGEPNTGRSYELDCLAAYIDSLEMPENRSAGQLDPAAVARGEELFNDQVIACVDCHPPPYFSDLKRHDVGTAYGPRERLGPEIDTPTLRDLARSAPYLHDGTAATLLDVLTTANLDDLHGVTSHLSADQLQDLVSFLLSLPANNSARLYRGAQLGSVPSHPPSASSRRGRPKEWIDRPPSSRRIALGRWVGGRVLSAADGLPIPGALVTLRATDHRTTTRDGGYFVMLLPDGDDEIEITASAPGYFIGSAVTGVPVGGLEIALRRHHGEDNPEYRWIDPTPSAASAGACGNCHTTILPQWQDNAHGRAISNPRFYSMYNGTDVEGVTTVAPGYLLDFPGTAGNCAGCHAPGAAVDAPFTTDMNAVRDDRVAGIHCDFCHKLGGAYLETIRAAGSSDAKLDPARPHRVVQPYRNMPGVFSLRMLRPPAGDQVFFGPLPDVPDPDAHLPLMRDSAFCAPCHEFSFWGTPIYSSYSEWLASPFADPVHGQTCQDCHMPSIGAIYFVPPELGGLARPASSLSSHLQRGVADLELMRSTLDLEVEVEQEGSELRVTVTVTNVGAGHHVPTDHPGRHLLLVVEALDAQGSPLAQLGGPQIPDWGGSLAGRPGTGYAKLLQDVASNEWPVVSYWKQALIRDDTRLPALASDQTTYSFETRDGTSVVRVRVLFRRLFEHLAERYGWDLGELIMAERTVTAPVSR